MSEQQLQSSYSSCLSIGASTIWYDRYIDDLLLVAVADVTAVSAFADFLNENPLNLKFTLQSDKMSMDFLDVTLMVKDGKVMSKSFRKITAGNTILHYKSCHPKHVRNNIPYGEYIRALCNCSNPVHFSKEAENITNRLKSRGYPKKILLNALNKVSSKKREDLLRCNNVKNHQKSNKNPVTFSTTFNMEYHQICQLITKHIPLLLYDPSLAKALDGGHRCVAPRAPTGFIPKSVFNGLKK